MSKGSETRGDNFLLEAEKALKRTTIFGFGKNQKFEDAAENFTKAGNAFKISKDWHQAGNAFLKSADCFSKTDSSSDALNAFIEAGSCFKNIDSTKAIECIMKSIEIYNDGGRFAPTAKLYKDIAEIYEQENNIPLAIENYQQASDIMSSDNKKQTAQQCMLKIATLASLQDEPGLHRASEIFETLGRESLETRLGAYSAKGYFFQSVLCLMAIGDFVASRSKNDSFKNVDFSYSSSRESQLLDKLIEACDGYDTEGFAQACADFDHITPLDSWKTSILLKAKKHLTSVAGEDVDLI